MITGVQIKMARAAVGWGVRELAAMADTNPNTISRIENGADALGGTLTKIQKALEAEGITFIDDGSISTEGGPGVRLK